MKALLVVSTLLLGLAAGAASAEWRRADPPGSPAALERAAEGVGQPAAEVATPRRGLRVRVRAPQLGARRVVGEILEVDDQILLLGLLDRAERVALPRASIRELEVSAGRRSRAREGAEVGGVVVGLGGALFGLVAGGLANLDCESDCHPKAPIVGGVVGSVIGAGAGAAVGALVGSTMETERWRALPHRGLDVRVVPGRHPAVRVSWSVTF
jgi:hypothetical protein